MPGNKFRVRDGVQNRGYVLVTLAAASTVLFGCMGLALDLGYFEYLKRRAQMAADAAAVAGALELARNSSSTTVVSSAKSDSSLNGFTDGTNGVTVTINNPPTSGTYSGDNNAVEAIVAQSRSTFFMQVLSVDSATVTTRAVAHTGGGPNCVYVLDSAAKEP